jgi:hypothetical protein
VTRLFEELHEDLNDRLLANRETAASMEFRLLCRRWGVKPELVLAELAHGFIVGDYDRTEE